MSAEFLRNPPSLLDLQSLDTKSLDTKSIAEHCTLAEAAERDAARYPDERGEILMEAAHHWERAGQLDQAIALLREVLTLGGQDAQFAHFSLADVCFKHGAESDAWEHLRVLEEMTPPHHGPVHLAAEMLEARGAYEAALRWYDRVLELMDPEELPKPGGMPSLKAIVLLGRQRCRTKLGLPADELDRAADIAEDNRQRFTDRIGRLAAASRTARASQPSALRMLVFQRAEQQLAAQRWPEVFTPEVVGNHSNVEKRLRELTAEHNTSRVSLVLGSVDGFAEYLRDNGGDPAEESVRLAYAEHAARQGRVLTWPPARNQLCWCGSQRKYKKCCAAPNHR